MREPRQIRAFAKAVAIVLIVLVHFGCNSNKMETAAPPEPPPLIQLRYWTPFTGGDQSFMYDLVNKFNEQNSDRIHVDLRQYKSEEYYEKLITAIVTEAAPEAAIVHSSKYAQYVPAGFLKPIDDLAAEAGIDWGDYHPNSLSGTLLDGRHYGIPLDTHFLVLYYNKQLLSQAGTLSQEEKPIIGRGEDGFRNFLQAAKDRLPAGVSPLSIPDVRVDSYWLWWSLYNQIDGSGSLISDRGEEADIDMEAAGQALRFVDSLYDDGLILPNIINHVKMFSDQKAATLIAGIWAVGLLEQTEGLDFGVIPLPVVYDKPAVWGDAHTFAFPRQESVDPAKQVAALEFANWIAQHGAGWAKAGHIPAAALAVESAEFLSFKHRSDYMDAVNDVRFFPKHPRLSKMNDRIIKDFEKMLDGRLTPEEVLRNMEKHIEVHLKEPVR